MKILKIFKSIHQFVLGVLFMIAYPSLALAQGIGASGIPNDLFTPVSGDKSMQILQSLFGGLPVFGGGGTDAFIAPIGTFNNLVLTVGGVLAAYTILAGTMMTAHDGEVLGKQFHSVWIPVRTALGAALVLPVFNGYCVAQVAVAWLLIQGIGLADAVWTKFTGDSNLTNVVAVGFNNPASYKLAEDILKAKLCVAALNAESQANPAVYSGANFSISTKTIATQIIPSGDAMSPPTVIPGKTIYQFGDATGNSNLAPDVCGSVTVQEYQGSLTDTTSSIAAINSAQQQALTGMMSDADAIINSAIQIVAQQQKAPGSYDTNNLRQQVNAMIGKYNNTVRQGGVNAYGNTQAYNQVAQNSSQDGWFLAGSWFMKLASMQEDAQQAVSAVPDSSSIQSADENDTIKQAIDKYMPVLTQITDNSLGAADFGITKQSSSDRPDIITKLFSKIDNMVISPNENPVMAMKRLGDWVLGISSLLIALTIGASGLSAAGSVVTVGLSLTILTTATMLMPLLTMMFILGITLSFVLPMLPMFIWIGAAIGWLILAVEAIIAAPLWVVMHLNPKGSDLVGTAGRGYMMVLSLMLRPVLMIFGLVAAIIMTNVVGQFIVTIFTSLFTMSQSSTNWLLWIIGYVIARPLIFGGMMFVFIKKMFSIIHVIPDQLLNWIGGGGASLGEYSKQMSASGAIALNQGMQQMSNMGSSIDNKGLEKARDLQSSQIQEKANSEMIEETGNKFGDKQGFENAVSGLLANASGGNASQRARNRGQAIRNADQKISSMAEMFGGPQSEGFQSMMKHLNSLSNANPPQNNAEFNQALKGAVQSTLAEKYGEGTATAMMNMTSTPNGGFHVGGMKGALDAINQYESSANQVGISPMESRANLTNAIASVAKAYIPSSTGGATTVLGGSSALAGAISSAGSGYRDTAKQMEAVQNAKLDSFAQAQLKTVEPTPATNQQVASAVEQSSNVQNEGTKEID